MKANDYLPTGTKVLNTSDGEVATVLSGFAFDSDTGWTEYELKTRFGIERWQRQDFILCSEVKDCDS